MKHIRSLAVSCALQHLANHGFLQRYISQHTYNPKVDALLDTMLGAVDSILQLPPGYIQSRRESTREIGEQLNSLAIYAYDLSQSAMASK